jgi:hypothetical protein
MEEAVINSGDTAWMLMSAGLVTLMIPGLVLFYGGMVRVKSVLNMMMMSFGALAIVFVLWIAYGFSLVFGDSVNGSGLIGDVSQFAFLKGLDNSEAVIGTIPAAVFVGFQGMFAAITVALISGAIADRAKFGAWLVFAGIWATVVYFPVAHWVFAFDDFVAKTGGWIANDLRFCWRYCCTHQCRSGRFGFSSSTRQACWFWQDANATTQPSTCNAWCRSLVVWLVWIQRRLCHCIKWNCRIGVTQHNWRNSGRCLGMATC